MIENCRIGDLIEVPAVQTVVRLESGKESSGEIVGSFVFTSDVDSHIHVFTRSLLKGTGQGYFLQGDFGSGKSHFLAALSAWLGGDVQSDLFTERHEGLRKIRENGKNFLPVPVSLVNYRGNTPLETILVEACEKELNRRGVEASLSLKSRFLDHLKTLLRDETLALQFCRKVEIKESDIDSWVDSNPQDAYTAGQLFLKNNGLDSFQILDNERSTVFESALDTATKAGFSGIVLLIDELSEFFRSKPDSPSLNEDARTLQLLGEIGRSKPLWIIAAVQESVERTGDIAQATFRKIKDRFPHKLHLSTLHIRDLISRRLVRMKPDGEKKVVSVFEEYCRHFPGFKANSAFFRSIYPVHPLTLSLLEGLGDLFSQHRGIVDFVHSRIAGDPARGIESMLDRPCTELLSPDAIYEHFSSRIAEYSSFYIYPSQIIPHLDELISDLLDDDEDRVLARRLVRILVLYAVHPTASQPSAAVLAELVSCMLSFQDTQANAQYVAEVLLDPLVENSRFLTRTAPMSGSAADATYAITTKEDQSKILRMRIERVMKDIEPDDSRLFSIPLSELPESFSWPGPSIWNGFVERTVVWRQSSRKAAVFFVQSGSEAAVCRQVDGLLSEGKLDFALAVSTENVSLDIPHTAVWKIGCEDMDRTVLKEYFACRMIAGDLKERNPADLPLIPQINEQLSKLEPAVRQILLQQIYEGSFDDPNIELEKPARQFKRFDRILEMAGEQLLENRYPRFKEIASRSLPPSLRLYQRIFDEFVVSGNITMRDARSRGIGELIETMAVPLGIVDVKSGSYLLSPNPASNQFLSCFLGLIPASGKTPVALLLKELFTGPYGVPKDTVCFLMASLAYCGHLSLINKGRALALDYIKLSTVDQVESVSPGEIISELDRETVLNSCPFLISGGNSAESFGLRQQRDAWQAALKFKTSAAALVSELQYKMQTLSGYSAFSYLDLDELASQCKKLWQVLEEIKVSYCAREGLERFLQAWRDSGLTSDMLGNLKRVHRFLTRHADRMVFVNHYVNHRSVIDASSDKEELADLRDACLIMLRSPDTMIIPDEGESFQGAFERFRECYFSHYANAHDSFQKSKAKPSLSRHALRAVKVIRSLASVPSLDRPKGTQQFLEWVDSPADRVCGRNLHEELLRSPVCGCGYQCGTAAEIHTGPDPEKEIERILKEYHTVLNSPEVLESISARSFALRDTDVRTSERLGKLHGFLRESEEGDSVTLRDLLDESTVRELNTALSGRTRIESKELRTLLGELSGRRLTPSRIRNIVEKWIGNTSGDAILSIDQSGVEQDYSCADPLIWPCLHEELFSGNVKEQNLSSQQIQSMSAELERSYPSDSLLGTFSKLNGAALVRFISKEPLHLNALRAAFGVLVDKVLNSDCTLPPIASVRFLDEAEGKRIVWRLRVLERLSRLSAGKYPDKLKSRLDLTALYSDNWAGSKIRSELVAFVKELQTGGSDWFSSLPPVTPVQLAEPVTVVLMDAVSPDVWLEVTDTCRQLFMRCVSGWFRTKAPSLTVNCINEMFGFPQESDPASELYSHGIEYINLSGDEERLWNDIIPPAAQGIPQLVRVSLFDKQAHAAIGRLAEMPLMLSDILTRNLPPFLEKMKKENRRLLLTSDHGLSFGAKGLHHGNGGLFEQVVFRAQWS
ncbi:MAG: DUF6079 family protein [Chitinispirillaceae bacterium]